MASQDPPDHRDDVEVAELRGVDLETARGELERAGATFHRPRARVLGRGGTRVAGRVAGFITAGRVAARKAASWPVPVPAGR